MKRAMRMLGAIVLVVALVAGTTSQRVFAKESKTVQDGDSGNAIENPIEEPPVVYDPGDFTSSNTGDWLNVKWTVVIAAYYYISKFLNIGGKEYKRKEKNMHDAWDCSVAHTCSCCNTILEQFRG